MPRVTLLLVLPALLTACAASQAPACEPSADTRVFEAADIGEQWIDYVWLEIPAAASEGTHPGRLFVASADPVGAIVPTMIDLSCADELVDYAPAQVTLEFDAGGGFKTSYGWKSCAACSECYMHWTFSLDVEGQVGEDSLRAELVLNETFHSGPMKLVSLDMPEVTRSCESPRGGIQWPSKIPAPRGAGEPRMKCKPSGACDDIRLVRGD
jgi:hypothetical protein